MRDLICQRWTAGRSRNPASPGCFDVWGELGEVVCVSHDAAVVIHIVQMHNEALRLAKDGPDMSNSGGAE